MAVDYEPNGYDYITLSLPSTFTSFAPYNTDLKARDGGEMFNRQTSDNSVLTSISADIDAYLRTRCGEETFVATHAIIITFENMKFWRKLFYPYFSFYPKKNINQPSTVSY